MVTNLVFEGGRESKIVKNLVFEGRKESKIALLMSFI